MTRLELKKIEAELAAVIAGKLNLELKIEEHLDNIERMQEHVKIQQTKEKELTEKLKNK